MESSTDKLPLSFIVYGAVALAAIITIIEMLQGKSMAHYFEFGPSSTLKVFGFTIDTYEKYCGLIAVIILVNVLEDMVMKSTRGGDDSHKGALEHAAKQLMTVVAAGTINVICSLSQLDLAAITLLVSSCLY